MHTEQIWCLKIVGRTFIVGITTEVTCQIIHPSIKSKLWLPLSIAIYVCGVCYYVNSLLLWSKTCLGFFPVPSHYVLSLESVKVSTFQWEGGGRLLFLNLATVKVLYPPMYSHNFASSKLYIKFTDKVFFMETIPTKNPHSNHVLPFPLWNHDDRKLI